MTLASSTQLQMRRYALAFIGLVASLCIVAPAAYSKSPWTSELDLEPSLRSAALVMAVRVTEVSEMPLIFGGKGSETFYQYSFEPIRILKGVYSRPLLLMTNAELLPYSRNFDPRDIRRDQRRLLLLGRSRIGYVGVHGGSTADLALPQLSGPTDPLLTATASLLALQELPDRYEMVARLSRQLDQTKGRGAVMLLAALDRRAYIAAQQDAAFLAVGRQLGSNESIVREAAARVLGDLLEADYLNSQANRETAVAALVASLNQADTSLAARVAVFQALGSAVAAVRDNDAAVRLVTLETPYDTLAELSARLDVLGELYQYQGAHPRAPSRSC